MAIKTTILKLIATACLCEGGARALVETGLRFVFFFFELMPLVSTAQNSQQRGSKLLRFSVCLLL